MTHEKTSNRQRAPRILHVVEQEKFIPPFIDLINKNFDPADHHFFFFAKGDQYQGESQAKVTRNSDYSTMLGTMVALTKYLNDAEKIILHGLFGSMVIFLLFLQPWLLRKCYWVIWGGELYTHVFDKRTLRWWVKEIFKHPVIKRIGHLLSYLPQDIEVARKWYGASGRYHECLMYPSNVYHQLSESLEPNEVINIQVGNSADPYNAHSEVFDLLKRVDDGRFFVFVPLSYGDKMYAEEVIKIGKAYFDSRFIPLTDFMAPTEYRRYLEQIDIAVFNHRRQQGMGNIISLLGCGKRVFLREETSSWSLLVDLGLTVTQVDAFDLSRLDRYHADANMKIIADFFSAAHLIEQYKRMFEEPA